LDLANLTDSSLKILENFTKHGYNLVSILDSAEALKYIKAIRSEFEKELQNPSDEIVKLLVNRFFDKPLTAPRLAAFKEYTKKAFSNSINESINFRLKNALNIDDTIPSKENEKLSAIDENVETPKFITTQEEIEGSQIVKAILRESIPSNRIFFRDTQSYFGILLDDNNRKPLCRLHLNGGKKYISLFNNNKSEAKIAISSIDDIYQYEKELLETVALYETELNPV
jgi:hypothetical protein